MRQIKETVGIAKFDDNKTLFHTDHKFPDCITLKIVVILIKI